MSNTESDGSSILPPAVQAWIDDCPKGWQRMAFRVPDGDAIQRRAQSALHGSYKAADYDPHKAVATMFAHEPQGLVAIGAIHWCRLYFDWSQTGTGFGQLSVERREDGSLHCGNEMMDREWVRKALHAFADHLADRVKLEDDPPSA